MLLVLWTLYNVSAFPFRAVSTKSCGVLFVFGPKLAILEFLKSGRTGQMSPCFPRLVITVCLNILYSVQTGVDHGACGVLRLLGISDLFL